MSLDAVVRSVLCLALLGPSIAGGQDPSPEFRELANKIALDPRFKDAEQYAKALPPTADMKKNVIAGNLLPELNSIYGWNLPPEGGWAPETVNDIIFEIILSPKYNAPVFLRSLKAGGPLLRELRQRGCVGHFNEKYHLTVPETGGLSFQDAEIFLYSIVGRPGFDSERLLTDLCPKTAPRVARLPSMGQPVNPVPVGTEREAEQDGRQRLKARIVLIGGAVLIVALIILLARSAARDLRRP